MGLGVLGGEGEVGLGVRGGVVLEMRRGGAGSRSGGRWGLE